MAHLKRLVLCSGPMPIETKSAKTKSSQYSFYKILNCTEVFILTLMTLN